MKNRPFRDVVLAGAIAITVFSSFPTTAMAQAWDHLPPGIAKKRDGWLPPGIAKKQRDRDRDWHRDWHHDHEDRDHDADRDRRRNRHRDRDQWRDRWQHRQIRQIRPIKQNRVSAPYRYHRPPVQDSHRQQTKNNWRNLSILAGGAALYGYLKHDPTITFAGLAGALYSLNRYEQDRKSQNQENRVRAALFSRPYFERDGHRYTRRLVTHNGQRYYQFVRA